MTDTPHDGGQRRVLRLTPAMERVMMNLDAGRPADAGISGMSASGGLVKTMGGLRRRGLLNLRDELTEAGRAWLTREG